MAFFWYHYITQTPYFDGLNLTVMFVVLGIGADDMFIFYDAWVQAQAVMPASQSKDILLRLSWTYRRAGKAMAITTFTTCVAFLATLSSPISAAQTFGVWAAWVILWDYIFSVTLFPVGIVLATAYPALRSCGCFNDEEACTGCCCIPCCKKPIQGLVVS